MNPAACAGVRLEEHLTIRSETEERPKFDCFTGNKTGTFSTIQYYYTIGTRELYLWGNDD